MSDTASSGIFVAESGPSGAPIALHRDTVAAFIGPAPRGPVDMPIAVRSVAEYLQRFGSPDKPSRLEIYLQQFFENGGQVAIVVRVCPAQVRNQLHLPAADGELLLEALHPGPFEHLRASVDYDQLEPDDARVFNLTLHRLAGTTQPRVVEQEIYPALSADPNAPEYVGDVLARSDLVHFVRSDTQGRPEATPGEDDIAGTGYVYAEVPPGASAIPTDYDLIGCASNGTGLFALEQLPRLDLLCVVPPDPRRSLGPVALFAAERYCRGRQALLLTEPPTHWRLVRDVLADKQRSLLASPNVVTCFPLPGDGSVLGALAGALVAADARAAVWTPASRPGLSLRYPWRPHLELSSLDQAALLRAGVNPLTVTEPGRIQMLGAVTMARGKGLAPEWCDIHLRRTSLFIVSGIAHSSRWLIFSERDPEQITETRAQICAFLQALHAEGALVGATPAEAWFLRGPESAEAGLFLEFGIALRRPGEFLCFRLQFRDGNCQVRELGWQPSLAMAV